MGSRRFAQVSTSDDDEDDEALVVTRRNQRQLKTPVSEEKEAPRLRKRKKVKLPEDDDEEEQDHDDGDNAKTKKAKYDRANDKENQTSNISEEEEGQSLEDAKPIGEPVKVTGKGKTRRTHYESFEFDGNQYEIEDPVLLVPEDRDQKPYVAIIKDISQKDGSIMVTGQWFYRPEEAEKEGGGSWQSTDTRELFYSFHRDDVPAESVMHKCVVHFVPKNKQLPNRKQHPGFIVQKVYDTVEKKLWKLTDKDYRDGKQHEIDILVQKTMSRLGDLPDIETDENPADPMDREDQLKSKRTLRRKSISPLDVSRDEEACKPDQLQKCETPGSCPTNASEYYSVLASFNELTGETQRDKWREKLLQGIQYMCNAGDDIKKDEKGKQSGDVSNENSNINQEASNGSRENMGKDVKSFIWPEAAVIAVAALEKASHDALASDFQKYNQKLRQLSFNLKNNSLLARRLLNGELEPSKILNMSPHELKEGLTAEEIAKKEPDDLQPMQMTDARCSRCMEFKVGLRDIIKAGHGDRYQLECIACGHSWYASRDEASILTIDASNSTINVGTSPLATAKFEEVEKKLVSPREPDKSADELLKKASEPYFPVLDAQKSFGKSKKDDHTEPSKHAD